MVHGATVLRAGVDVLVTPFDTCMPCDSMRAGDLGFLAHSHWSVFERVHLKKCNYKCNITNRKYKCNKSLVHKHDQTTYYIAHLS